MRTLPALLAGAAILIGASQAFAQFNPGTPTTTPSEDFSLEVGLVYWKPTPELLVNTDALNNLGGPVDFVGEFGIENDRFREIRATLKPGRKHRIRIAYLPITYTQSAFLEREVTFGNRTFTVGADALADIEWKLWRFGYQYDVVSGPGGFVGVIGEVKYNQVAASITATGVGRAEAEVSAPIPTVGAVARGYLGDGLSVTAEFTGLSLDREFLSGKFYDLDVYGTVNLGRNLGVNVGYRSVTAEYLVDADEGNLKLEGLYFGAALRF